MKPLCVIIQMKAVLPSGTVRRFFSSVLNLALLGEKGLTLQICYQTQMKIHVTFLKLTVLFDVF